MFKIRLNSGKFYVGGKDRRVWYFATAAEARSHMKRHRLKGRIIQVHMRKHRTNKPKGTRKGKGIKGRKGSKGRKGRKGRGRPKGRRGRKLGTSFADIYGSGFF